jgi:DNA polymerase IV (DinB-like DNA polymerase)
LPRVIFHLDLDAFYASVEERENPSLRGKPLIIGADPKGGNGRGVVVSCSYEARKRGVHSGQPISRAYKLCPDGTYIRPNLALYGQASNDVMNVIRGFGDKFEQVSIDEAFLDVSQSCARYGGPVELAKRIKAEVKLKEDLTCSIGIATNKSAAKIASDLQKPDGLTYVPPEKVKEFLSVLPVSKISGIGKKTDQQLGEIGIRTIGELARYPPRKLYKQFGKSAIWLWAIANAEEQVEVQENYVMKSIGAEHTFDVDTDNWTEVNHQLLALIETVHQRLLEQKKSFRTVTLKIRFTGFETYTREKTLKFPTPNKEVIVDTIRGLSEEFLNRKKRVRLVGVRLSGLEDASERPKFSGTLDSFAGTS